MDKRLILIFLALAVIISTTLACGSTPVSQIKSIIVEAAPQPDKQAWTQISSYNVGSNFFVHCFFGSCGYNFDGYLPTTVNNGQVLVLIMNDGGIVRIKVLKNQLWIEK